MAKKTHACAKCGRHDVVMVVRRKKSGLFNGRPFNICVSCVKSYDAKRARKEGGL